MHEPRRVSLTDRERRTLRSIEEDLAADDPGLAGLLRDGGRRARRTARAVLLVSSVIGAFGLLLADVVLQTRGAMLLLAFVPALWWLARTSARRW